jgi:hypothetical protein
MREDLFYPIIDEKTPVIVSALYGKPKKEAEKVLREYIMLIERAMLKLDGVPYKKWLENQPEEKQLEILGWKRFKEFKNENIG